MRRVTGALSIAFAAGGIVASAQSPALAHGAEFDVVVEVVGVDAANPAEVAVGIVLTFLDGDPVAAASVTIRAESDKTTVDVQAREEVPGVYTALLVLGPGGWVVTVDVTAVNASGSVTFTNVVTDTPIQQPVVRVDTARPERQGSSVGPGDSVLGGRGESPVQTTTTDLRIEALVREATAPLRIEYGVVAAASQVALRATSSRDEVATAVLAPQTVGVFSGVLEYPDGGVWAVELLVDGVPVADFGENLPWPHYSTEAGSPKIKVETAEPSLQGTLITLDSSPIFGRHSDEAGVEPDEAPPSSTPETTIGRTSLPFSNEVTVRLPSTAGELRRQVVIRWTHLLAILSWTVGIAALYRKWSGRWWVPITVGGVVATVSTGAALALWGVPTAYPGLFRWSDLGDRLYGAAYQASFIVKMAFVLLAIVATGVLIAKRSSARALGVAVAAMAGAIATVVVMAQLHLWAHL